MPPGITYWRYVTVETNDGPQSVPVATTRPLAVCEKDLEDEDVLALLRQLIKVAYRRGLSLMPGQRAEQGNGDEMFQVLAQGGTVTVSDLGDLLEVIESAPPEKPVR